MRLYEIPLELGAMEAALVETGGELTPEMEQQFDALLRAGKDKIEAAAHIVRQMEADAAHCKAEMARLAARKKALDSASERLQALLIGAVDSFGGKVKTALVTVWAQNSKPYTAVDAAPGTDLQRLAESDPDLVRVSYELDRAFIQQLVKNNQTLPECILLTPMPGVRFLRIL